MNVYRPTVCFLQMTVRPGSRSRWCACAPCPTWGLEASSGPVTGFFPSSVLNMADPVLRSSLFPHFLSLVIYPKDKFHLPLSLARCNGSVAQIKLGPVLLVTTGLAYSKRAQFWTQRCQIISLCGRIFLKGQCGETMHTTDMNLYENALFLSFTAHPCSTGLSLSQVSSLFSLILPPNFITWNDFILWGFLLSAYPPVTWLEKWHLWRSQWWRLGALRFGDVERRSFDSTDLEQLSVSSTPFSTSHWWRDLVARWVHHLFLDQNTCDEH